MSFQTLETLPVPPALPQPLSLTWPALPNHSPVPVPTDHTQPHIYQSIPSPSFQSVICILPCFAALLSGFLLCLFELVHHLFQLNMPFSDFPFGVLTLVI